MLLLVLVAMVRVQDPHLWTWLTPVEGASISQATTRESAEAEAEVEVQAMPDLRIDRAGATAPDDSSRDLSEHARAGRADPDGQGVFNPLGLKRLDTFRGLDPELLERLQDLVEVRSEELPAIYQALAWASTTPPEKLARLVRPDVLLTNLLQDRDAVRGSVVRIEGTLHRLIRHEGAERWNPYGIQTYYEAWIYSKEQMDLPAKHVFPTVVFVTHVPEGLEPGESLKESVAVNGVFLKLMTYRAASDQRRFAPVLAAYALEWRRPRSMSGLGIYWLLAIVAAVGLVLISMATWSAREAKKAESMRMATRPRENPNIDVRFLDDASGKPDEEASS